MKKNIRAILLSLCFIVTFVNCYAESLADSSADRSVKSLSPKLRALLKQEMRAIENGMKNMVPAYASGNLSEVAKVAGQIKNSYLLKQEITEAQKHELHKTLSKGFFSKDKQFHKYAGMLEHVSEEKHTELVSFYYAKLLDSCISCHAEHAVHAFPSLTEELTNSGHHH